MTIRDNNGFTLIELMIVMALAAVAFTGYVQIQQQEANQLMAKKLGSTEIFVYNNAVQKFLTAHSGQDPATVIGVRSGVDWLKSTACGGSADDSYLPCSFLANTGGRTTLGAMEFTTEIIHNTSPTATAPKGFQARTVLSPFQGNSLGQTSSSTLGLAAMVASSTFLGSDFGGGNSPGTVIYCPDINPMPPGMAPYCGAERDQIVSFAFNNGSNDIWLRTDHGNVQRSAIEYNSTPNSDPSTLSDLNDIDARNQRHLRNVARIYNLNDAGTNAGSQNLIIGKRMGNAAVAAGAGTIASDGVIIDADMYILGELIVRDAITASADITSENGDIKALAGNVEAGGDIIGGNNAIINGWIEAKEFRDLDDSTFVLDPAGISTLNDIRLDEIESRGDNLGITANNIEFKNKTASGGPEANLTGTVDVSNLQVKKNGKAYSLESLIPNLTLIQTKLITSPMTQSVPGAYINGQCGGRSNVRVFVQPLVDEVVTKNGIGGQSRYVLYSSGSYHYRAENLLYSNASNRWARNSRAILQFYCVR